MLKHSKSYVAKIQSIDAKLAGHVRKLDVKLQSFCGSGFSSFAVCSGGFKVGGARGKTKKRGPSDDVIILSQP